MARLVESLRTGRGPVFILVALLALAALVAVAYRDATGNGFHFDDNDNIVDHLPLHMTTLDAASLARAWSEPFLAKRPLPSLSFALDWWRGRGQPAAFQVTNLLIHFVNAALVFLLLRQVGGGTSPPGLRTGLAALLAAGLWAVHPIQVQTVTYIVQRMAELSALFSLLSVICYIRGRTAARARPAWLIGALLAFGLGAVSKENAWITPALWWLAEFGLCRAGRPALSGRGDWLLFGLPFGLPFVLSLYVALDLAGGGPLAERFLPGYAGRDFSLAERLLTQPRVVLFHLSQLIWPAPGRFSVEHDFVYSSGLFSPPTTALALLLVLGWCAAGLAALVSVRHRVAGFWMLWIPVALIPESSVPPLEMVFEHRMYLPVVGLAGLIGLVLARASWDWRPGAAAGGIALLALLWITPQQVRVWRDDLSLYGNAVRAAPGSGRAWSGYGESLVKAGRTVEAAEALERALRYDPEQYGAWEKLGVLRMDAGDLTGADQALREAHRLSGGKHSVANHIGELYLRLDNPAAALDQFIAASARRPDEPIYRWNQAVALEKLGDCRAAAELWRAYLGLEPDPVERAKVEAHLAEGCGATTGR